MRSGEQTATVSRTRLRVGLILTVLPVVFLLFDSVIHIMRIAPVVESFEQMGYPISVSLTLGVVEFICVALYAFRRTSVLGAILLTGYLGGAISAHVRIGSPLFSHTLFPVYVAALLWGGLYLRERNLRALLPLRSELTQQE